MNPVVHFEMPYQDPHRMAKFYESVFDWHTKELGKESGDYVTAKTTESDDHGPKRAGAINGGFFPKKDHSEQQHPSVVISVDDLEQAMKKVKKAGGKVIGTPTDIPQVGRYVFFDDPEGNRVSMLQPLPRHHA